MCKLLVLLKQGPEVVPPEDRQAACEKQAVRRFKCYIFCWIMTFFTNLGQITLAYEEEVA
jgi:hypothetical protein